MLNANNNFYQSMLSNKQGFDGEYPKDDNLTPATLIEKSITENGEYNASEDNADGYSKVTVDVAGGGGETFEVEIDYDSTSNKFVANKTCQEVVTAYDDGMVIKLTNGEALEQLMQQAGFIAVDKPYAYDKETYSSQPYSNSLWFNWATRAGSSEIFPIYWAYSSDFSEEIINILQQ